MSALEGAAKYLNNLLLARGLLHDGRPLEFAGANNSTEQEDATKSKIINLVHDLVLRRDRETERYEAMVATIRNMRAEESQRLLNFQRLQDKNAQLQSELNVAHSHERTLQTSIRKTDSQAKDLREQMVKAKSLADQVRAKCSSDIKKRDLEIEKLKGHIANFQRGTKQASRMKLHIINPQVTTRGGKERRGHQDVNSQEWSLEKETNDLLAAIVNETSGENVALRKVIDNAINTLRDLTGLTSSQLDQQKEELGSSHQSHESEQPTVPLLSYHVLERRMNLVVEHCKALLKDPSFVSIEEVNIREEEIIKLRAGWEKMADRWKEAVVMMSQWKQRMASEGRTEDVSEFSDLSFGRSVAVRPNGEPVLGHDTDLSSIIEHETADTDASDADNIDQSPLMSPEDDESELELEFEPAAKRLASSPAKRGVRLPSPSRALREISSNANSKPATTKAGQDNAARTHTSVSESGADQSTPSMPNLAKGRGALTGSRSSGKLQKMTVADKLAAVEAEAVAAESLRKTQTTHKRSAQSRSTRSRGTGRRRSTLSPEELANLMKAR